VTLLVLSRFAHFSASLFAFGASAYLWLFAPKTLQQALALAVGRLVAWASVIALITALTWLALEAASMADDSSAVADPSLIVSVLVDTGFGQAWILRLILAAALVALACARPRNWAAVAVVAGLSLASLALVGHAAMRAGLAGMGQRANDAMHLLAAGGWLGGLGGFILSLQAYGDQALRHDAVVAMRRFSFWGQFAVTALVLTGVANVLLVSDRAPIPPTTPYLALLDAKLVVVAAMIALALANRFAIAPRLAQGSRALAVLKTTSLIETALGMIVVALVSVFALLDPH
jgi:putative copper resistance protein D